MRYSVAAGAALVAAANASPLIEARAAPSAAAPSGCSPNYSGKFQIQTVNVTTSSKVKRQDGTLLISLQDGTLTDEQGRVADIVANGQFQFDPAPGQPGYIYNSGFSACQNGSLALGGSTIFYQCLSGNFYNIYDRSTGAQCSPIYITILKSGSSSGAASQQADGQPTASPASQISDGQVQATTAAAVTQISDGQVQATTAAAVTQISDGQIQATTGAAVTQISDGQIQASTGKPVTQISDGQVQAPTAKPVTQISDGQIQAPTSTGKPVTQISDGQIQAPTNGTMKPTSTMKPVAYTGAASKLSAAGLLGLAGAAVAFL